jgi:nuclear transport factor 2 (NTF2) superfamily protein
LSLVNLTSPNRVREKLEQAVDRSVGSGGQRWEYDDEGYMRRRDASINDYRIEPGERRIHIG